MIINNINSSISYVIYVYVLHRIASCFLYCRGNYQFWYLTDFLCTPSKPASYLENCTPCTKLAQYTWLQLPLLLFSFDSSQLCARLRHLNNHFLALLLVMPYQRHDSVNPIHHKSYRLTPAELQGMIRHLCIHETTTMSQRCTFPGATNSNTSTSHAFPIFAPTSSHLVENDCADQQNHMYYSISPQLLITGL